MKKIQNFAAKAVCVAHSWLSSWGLKVTIPPEGDVSGTLNVEGKTVRFVEDVFAPVTISAAAPVLTDGPSKICPKCSKPGNIDVDFGYRVPKKLGRKIPQSWCRSCRRGKIVMAVATEILLNAKEVSSIDIKRVLAEIHKLTKQLGFGEPVGERIVSDSRKRMSTDDFEGVSMRLTQFARTVNPPLHIMEKYRPIIRREAGRAMRRYGKVVSRMGFDQDDLENVGLVFFVNYYHQSARKTADGINEAYLVYALRQQFSRFNSVTHDKLRNVEFSAAGVGVDEVVGSPVTGSIVNKNSLGEAIYERPDTFEMEAEPEEDGRSATGRRNMASMALNSRLGVMPHDKMVEVLTEVEGSEFADFYARREAARRLKEHRQTCASCVEPVQEK